MNFLTLTGIFLMLAGLIMGFVFSATSNNIEYVDCFDKYGNKILGTVCEQETNPLVMNSILIFFIGGTIILAGFIKEASQEGLQVGYL